MFSDARSHVRDDNERGRRRPRCHESRAVDFALYAWLDMERGIAHGMWHGTGTGGRTGCIHIGQAYGVCLLVVRMLGEEGRVIFFLYHCAFIAFMEGGRGGMPNELKIEVTRCFEGSANT